MNELETTLTTHKDIFPIVGWLVIIIGWIFNGLDARGRERRREQTEYLRRMLTQIDSLENDAVEHYSNPPTSTQATLAARRIKYGVSRLSKQIAFGILHHFILRSIDPPLIAFRRAITGADFEDADRPAHPANSTRQSEIAEACATIRIELDRAILVLVQKK